MQPTNLMSQILIPGVAQSREITYDVITNFSNRESKSFEQNFLFYIIAPTTIFDFVRLYLLKEKHGICGMIENSYGLW